MTRRIYPNPPIVEAVIEFRFPPSEVQVDVAEGLKSALGDIYDAPNTHQDWIEAQVAFDHAAISTSARRTPHRTILKSSTGVRLLGCSAETLSVHILAPYPGWENFLEQARQAVGALPAPILDGPLNRIGIRVIDRIELPGNAVFSDYLTVMASRPPAMPETLLGYNYLVQSIDPETGTLSQLNIRIAPVTSDEVGPILEYDLLLQRHGLPLCQFREPEWHPHLDELHRRQREIFEQSITDEMRMLFQ